MSEIFKALDKAGSLLGDLKGSESDERIEPETSVALPLFDETTVELGRLRDRGFRAITKPDHAASEQMRVLRAKIKVLGETPPFDCFGIVSAAKEEGKSTIALGLAVSLAQEAGHRVLLVEANLRRPVMTVRLGMTPRPGLSNWLAGNIEAVPLTRLNPLGVSLLPGGSPVANPAELLDTEPMSRLLATCRQSFDFTIVDCAALTPVADSVVLQDHLDGFLLVVRSRKTARETIFGALSHVKEGVIKGVVFNDHRVIFR
jgi:succinoglycan biosynthesis transport protein ExoP